MPASTPRRLVRCSLFALAFLFPLAAGCAKKKQTASVKGTVTYKGKLLKAGTVSFVTSDNRIGSGRITALGEYTVSEAPIGDAKITVTMPKASPMAMARPSGMVTKPPPGMEPPAESAQSTDPRDFIPLPKKYETAATTDLKFTVAPGENTFNIPLNP